MSESKIRISEQYKKCGNCGAYRKVENGIVEECRNCKDGEYDLNEIQENPPL